MQTYPKELWRTFQFLTQKLGEFIPKKQQLKSTDLQPTKKFDQTLFIKKPVRIKQRIQQEPHDFSVRLQMHWKEVSLLYFFWICFEELLSKNQVIHRRTCQFCTVLDIEYLGKEKLTNLLQMKIVAIRTLCKLISYDFAPTTGLRFHILL